MVSPVLANDWRGPSEDSRTISLTSVSRTATDKQDDLENSRLTLSGHRHQDDSSSSDDEAEDKLRLNCEPVEEDTYGFTIAAIVRDMHWFTKGTNWYGLRVLRLLSSFVLLFFTLAFQVFLIYFIRKMLTARSVHDIRSIYSSYEKHMYPNHTTLLFHGGKGYHRGVDGYRVDARFNLMEDDDKDAVCQIPLSQPFYLGMVLLVWSMTCTLQFKAVFSRVKQLVWLPRTVHSMQFSTCSMDEEVPNVQKIKGLTCGVKTTLVLLVFLPQLCITGFLLWLGSRWLVATADLEDLLMNALALEFVLNLKDAIYATWVPLRSKVETQRTYIMPHKRTAKVSCLDFFGSFVWGGLAIAWVVFYINHQKVLIDYRWDVKDLCELYLTQVAVG